MTAALVVGNLLVFWYELSLGRQLGPFVDRWGLVPAALRRVLEGDGEALGVLITPLTAMFLHASWAHLLGNLVYLWFFGRLAEEGLGRARFGALFALAGCAAALAHVVGAPFSSTPAIGASGAVAGLAGGYLPLRAGASGIKVSRGIDLLAALLLFVWLTNAALRGALQLMQDGGGATPISFWGHFAGFLTGAILVSLFRFLR